MKDYDALRNAFKLGYHLSSGSPELVTLNTYILCLIDTMETNGVDVNLATILIIDAADKMRTFKEE